MYKGVTTIPYTQVDSLVKSASTLGVYGLSNLNPHLSNRTTNDNRPANVNPYHQPSSRLNGSANDEFGSLVENESLSHSILSKNHRTNASPLQQAEKGSEAGSSGVKKGNGKPKIDLPKLSRGRPSLKTRAAREAAMAAAAAADLSFETVDEQPVHSNASEAKLPPVTTNVNDATSSPPLAPTIVPKKRGRKKKDVSLKKGVSKQKTASFGLSLKII